MSSPHSRNASTRLPISTAGSRRGTPGRSRNPRRHTGRRCRTPSRSQPRNGVTPSVIRVGGIDATDPPLRGSRRGGPIIASRPSQTLPEAAQGAARPVKGGDGYRRRGKPFTGRDTPPTLPVGMATAFFRIAVFTSLITLAHRTTPRSPSLPCGERLARWFLANWLRPVCDFPEPAERNLTF